MGWYTMPMLPLRGRMALGLLLVLGAAAFISGINWGLPSRAVDDFFYGSHPAWTGKQLFDLTGGWSNDDNVGADVARTPLASRDQVVIVNDTDDKRAKIIAQYHLYSYQPDEMITLRALGQMKPSRLQMDPKLYQYGGLWIYPVGVLLELASKVHYLQLKTDVAYYLDHPADFGRFYVVARFYTVLWALVGVVAVFAIVRRITGSWSFGCVGGACFIVMPVVMNMAHEAKPHLPGAVLMLLAALVAARYVESGQRRWWIGAGLLCGAAVAMVLSCVPVFAVLVVMVLLRKMTWKERAKIIVGSGTIGLLVYLLTNPYIPINLIANQQVLRSNFGNSRAFYHAALTPGGIANALRLIAVGAAPLLAIGGVIGAIALGMRALKHRHSDDKQEIRRRAMGVLLAAPALWVAGQCIAFAAAKPAEFGRFAILPDIFLMIEAIVAIATFVRQPRLALALLGILWITTAVPGGIYLQGFLNDSARHTPRLALANQLRRLGAKGATTLDVYAEPAPYCQPPLDLWKWKIRLLPKGTPWPPQSSDSDVALRTVDVPADEGLWGWLFGTPISWADKPFELRVRQRKK
jgi:hypothetical protein